MQNHAQNVVDQLVPDPFLKNQNWAYLWINHVKFYTVGFQLLVFEDDQNILRLRCWPLAFTSYKTFLKKRKRSGTSLPALYSAWFFKKNLFQLIFCQLTRFHYFVAFSSWDIGQYVYCNCLFPGFWCHKFWN